MSTTNPTLTNAWSLIVTAGDEFTLSCRNAAPVELAVSDTETAPTITSGHILVPHQNEGANRATVGPGYVYARLAGGQTGPIPVVLHSWTE